MMNNSHYQDLDKLISEYEEDTKLIKSERLIIKNYPKVFTMSVVSSFEYYIKYYLKGFIDSQVYNISMMYPCIDNLLRQSQNRSIIDRMYAKLKGYEKNGIENLSAIDFYALFNGNDFKDKVIENFKIERQNRIENVNDLIGKLTLFIGTSSSYDNDYAKYTDIKGRLDLCTFVQAEKSFLSLKLRRNRVAHNYLSGLTDSFEDIRNFYYDAVLYVVALESTLESLTLIPT